MHGAGGYVSCKDFIKLVSIRHACARLIKSSSLVPAPISPRFSNTMIMFAFSIKIRQVWGKFWRAYVVDECPAEDWEWFEGLKFLPKNTSSMAVSTQAPFLSSQPAKFFRENLAFEADG